MARRKKVEEKSIESDQRVVDAALNDASLALQEQLNVLDVKFITVGLRRHTDELVVYLLKRSDVKKVPAVYRKMKVVAVVMNMPITGEE